MPTRRVRDPIHGFVEIRPDEGAVLDTIVMQRLRQVKQLALASLVYPGAVHTRFDHSLGVLHVADKMCNVLGVSEVHHRRIIRLAALLHDIGHGPFSHVSEHVLDMLASETQGQTTPTDKIHERITQELLRRHPALNVLSSTDRESIADLLHHGWECAIHKEILSGPLDADKQDYLLRDSYFCGVTYGSYDIQQLHETLLRHPSGANGNLAVEYDGLHVLEQFVLAKYYMTTQVYRHRVRIITDNMLVRALQLGVEQDNIAVLRALYVYQPANEAYINNFLAWDDVRLTAELLRPEYEVTLAGRLFRNLARRELLKEVFRIVISDLGVSDAIRMEWKTVYGRIRERVEREIAERLRQVLTTGDYDAELIDTCTVLYSSTIEAVRKLSRNNERSIPVVRRDGVAAVFEDESPLLAIPDRAEKDHAMLDLVEKKMSDIWIHCFAPVRYRDNLQKQRIMQAAGAVVREVMQAAIAEVTTPATITAGDEQ